MRASRFTILSCSYRPESRSRLLAREAERRLRADERDVAFVDMRDLTLPPFDGETAFTHPDYAPLHRAIADADGILIAAPVYNWGLGGAVRPLIELTGATEPPGLGSAWFDKVVTFLCVGGLPHGYMAFGATALALLLDFRCILNPQMVYAAERDWTDEGALTAALSARVAKAVQVKLELTGALSRRSYRSEWSL